VTPARAALPERRMRPAKIAERGAGRSHILNLQRLLLAPCPRLTSYPRRRTFRPVHRHGIFEGLIDVSGGWRVEDGGWKVRSVGAATASMGAFSASSPPSVGSADISPTRGEIAETAVQGRKMVTAVQRPKQQTTRHRLIAPASIVQGIRLAERPATCRSPSLWGGGRNGLRSRANDPVNRLP
ncbi:hypothetical protein PDO_1605, partial [Rhizobium sp. PDO1-076]